MTGARGWPMVPADMAEVRQRGDAASALLRREARAARGRLGLPLGLGLAQVTIGIAQAWLIAGLIAKLLGYGAAGLEMTPELTASMPVSIRSLIRSARFRSRVKT